VSGARAVLALAALAAVLAPRTATGQTPRVARHPTVTVIDNAFARGVQRPVVRVRAGTVVTWRWSAQQSHGIEVASGPERFSAPIRNHGTFRHRFARRGTYRIVCPLHAPGMRMTVRVSVAGPAPRR
jgi:plastocyanin